MHRRRGQGGVSLGRGTDNAAVLPARGPDLRDQLADCSEGAVSGPVPGDRDAGCECSDRSSGDPSTLKGAFIVVTRLSAAVANERPGCRKCRNGGRGLVIKGHGPLLELCERDIGYQDCPEDSLVCGA
ncbi:hypothetical protein chiPu_0024234 [Chiloscyllium punctatum]|uniref:Uncharacterized protein n=1 Tax=Chiloscyllium punctatum TaxID=137246 RepID=A0A401TBT2_CHIPU|nr:hypothetical protein [Chiloscyllium punctatum]